MNSIRSGMNYLSSKTKQGAASASKETNKTIAKDRNARFSTRFRAAGNSVRDKVQETGHKSDAAAFKHGAKHNY